MLNIIKITVLHTSRICTRPDSSNQREIVLFKEFCLWRSTLYDCCYLMLLGWLWDIAVQCCWRVWHFPSLTLAESLLSFFSSPFYFRLTLWLWKLLLQSVYADVRHSYVFFFFNPSQLICILLKIYPGQICRQLYILTAG